MNTQQQANAQPAQSYTDGLECGFCGQEFVFSAPATFGDVAAALEGHICPATNIRPFFVRVVKQ